MAFANDIRNFEAGLVQRMRDAFEQSRRNAAARKVYRQTYAELSTLSQRELDDLGIARANIDEIAREAAYGK